MLPKTNVIVRPSVKTESFTAEMGPVFKIMPDKIFRPKSVNAWFITCQKKWFPKIEEAGHKTNQLWIHLCKI